ncbi:similar to Saccharomyces cerevisiae YBR199W KTR4 Putative mannosyltransferase involved in protein glycosylation [Maudiozyma saulgeensis]|uniref:Similar to Saccharomyces cerevisiae YBR199W KTR4 Putative mannosyltransferase involved in protein glycosylation n=1 Tax=Maudiozyma saulgeensis TaxID=1789683 RepID=A0A1X7R2Y2_9SACH|nr:similar to Saccharomyces cerevisiae YBR199W KTR4 Putative mannosyltransferase involved in protein glycosylation [Kazachstania saulgeensis]
MRLLLSMCRRRFSLRTMFLGILVMAVLSIIFVMTVGSNDSINYDEYLGTVKDHANNVIEYVGDKIGYFGNSDTLQPGYVWENHYYDEETISQLLTRIDTPLFPEDQVNKANIRKTYQENLKLYRDTISKEIDEPQVEDLVRDNGSNFNAGNAVPATILSLVRNEDLNELIESIKQIEEKFNAKFNYPYTFLNDNEFTEEFKESVRHLLPDEREVRFGKISEEDWNIPEIVDKEKYKQGIELLESEGVSYASKESYHNMCRFYSRTFYKHPLLKDIKYTWRLEPGVKFYCDIDYDVFKFMSDHNKIYGFVLNLYDSPQSVKSLWKDTRSFLQDNPDYINEEGSFDWIKENMQKSVNFNITEGYSTCHFWTNFEITNLDFLRSEPYEAYMDFLESKGGFYYERWGDAPVRSLALGLFADKSQIHWFRDIGYNHFPYTNCPNSAKCDKRCSPGSFTPWNDLEIENCQATWMKYSMTDDDLNLYYKKKDD